MIRDLTKVRNLTRGPRRAHVEALLASPERAVDSLTDSILNAWHVLLEPDWEQARRCLDADLALRSRQLVSEGTGAVIDSLHERISWHEGAVRVSTTIWSEALDCDSSGLLLVPSVFSWPNCQVVTDGPGVPTIYYPAYAVTEAWPTATEDQVRGREIALGRARARCLLALASPMSTTRLAQAVDVTPPTATHHIAALRAAGLVTSARAGREMLHTRTILGNALATRSF